MRIAIDLTPLYGRKWTGVELYAIDLYKALKKTHHEIIPIFHVKNEIDNNSNAYIINQSTRLILENIKIVTAIKRIKPALTLFPIFPPPINIYFSCTSKIVPTIHDLAFIKYRNTLNLAAKYYLTPKALVALKKSDAIITISETIKSELQIYTQKPIYNCGENISESYQNCTTKCSIDYLKKWNLEPDNYIISVSTIEPRKNVKYLLKVIQSFLKKENLKIVLVGRKGWGKDDELKELINKMQDRIIFTEYISQECLFSLYHYAKAFALLSLDEGFGRTPFEAVACGCRKIILSDIKIFHETFENNALFLPLNDLEQSQKLLQNEAIPYINDQFKIPYKDIEKKIPFFLKNIQ